MGGWVRVDCDHAADGIWTQSGAAYCVGTFPVSDQLKVQLVAWQAKFDSDARPWEDDDGYDWDAHGRVGAALAVRIKQELPDWTVVAFDRLVLPDGSLGERVPYPGEGRV